MTVDIQPIQIWQAGQVQTATKFELITIFDNLESTATTYYQLLTSDSVQLAQGNQQIEGQDYQDWNNDPDANAWILNWSATQLGITII
jgi:hypothetical protein